jgi:hypothetical protein
MLWNAITHPLIDELRKKYNRTKAQHVALLPVLENMHFGVPTHLETLLQNFSTGPIQPPAKNLEILAIPVQLKNDEDTTDENDPPNKRLIYAYTAGLKVMFCFLAESWVHAWPTPQPTGGKKICMAQTKYPALPGGKNIRHHSSQTIRIRRESRTTWEKVSVMTKATPLEQQEDLSLYVGMQTKYKLFHDLMDNDRVTIGGLIGEDL